MILDRWSSQGDNSKLTTECLRERVAGIRRDGGLSDSRRERGPDGDICRDTTVVGQRVTGDDDLGALGQPHRFRAEVGKQQDQPIVVRRGIDEREHVVGISVDPIHPTVTETVLPASRQIRPIQLERRTVDTVLPVDGELPKRRG